MVKTPLTLSASHFSLALPNSSLFLHSSILLYPSRDPGGLQVCRDTPAAVCCPRTGRHHRLGISFDRVSDSIITSGGVRALREPVNPPKSHPSTLNRARCQIHSTYTPPALYRVTAKAALMHRSCSFQPDIHGQHTQAGNSPTGLQLDSVNDGSFP